MKGDLVGEVGDVLKRAAADVELHGVFRMPREDLEETCPVIAINAHAWNLVSDFVTDIDEIERGVDKLSTKAEAAVRAVIGGEAHIPDWNDLQASRAVVAAVMRESADLVDLLYGQ